MDRAGLIKMVRNEVKRTVEQVELLKDIRRAIIAFSAGPDSVCLLDVLHYLYGKRVEFYLVYINHHLRPRKVTRYEEELTRHYAERYGLGYKIVDVRVRKSRLGVEASARKMRYDALIRCQSEFRAQAVFLGHNLDDLIETFLMNLIRGSGTRGLAGLPVRRGPFLRPLINIKKRSILDYLKARGLAYSFDQTNLDLRFRRNILREKIIPELLKLNPELHTVIKRTIEITKADNDYLEKRAEKVYKKIVRQEDELLILDIKGILRYNLSIVMRVLMDAICELAGSFDGFESKHLYAVLGLIDKGSGKKISLPRNLFARREYDKIVLGQNRAEKMRRVEIAEDGENRIIQNLRLTTELVSHFDLKTRQANCEVFDYDKIFPPLYLRSRRKGDYIETKVGRKKLKKLYNEFKIPIHKRDQPILLCDRKGILWILGYQRSARGFIDNKTKRFLVVKVEAID